MLLWKAVIFVAFCQAVDLTENGTAENNSVEKSPLCEEDWIQHGSVCLWMSNAETDWENASKHCLSLGGLLASIHSKEQSDFVNTLMLERIPPLSYKSRYLWIGLHDPKQNNFWEDGSRVGFTNWDYLEPFGNVKCVAMKIPMKGKVGKWTVIACYLFNRYLCQKQIQLFENVATANYSENRSSLGEDWNQHDFVNTLMLERIPRVSYMGRYLWIGLHDPKQNYFWEDGSRVGFTNWDYLEPMGIVNCVAIIVPRGGNVGKWQVIACYLSNRFLCQKQIQLIENVATANYSEKRSSLGEDWNQHVQLIENVATANYSEKRSSLGEDWNQHDCSSVTLLVVSIILALLLFSLFVGVIYCKRTWLRYKCLDFTSVFYRSSSDLGQRNIDSETSTEKQNENILPIYSNVEHLEKISFSFPNVQT